MNVDEYFDKNQRHREGLVLLHDIITSTGLTPTIKWNAPVYTLEGKNVVGLGGFKAYFGLWFFQGGLLKDEKQLLTNAQDGKTKALRQWRFEKAGDINADLVKEYVLEAIANQKAGREIKPEKKPLVIPIELKEAMASDANLESAFDKLSLTCKREYADHIGEAKKEETRLRRLNKMIPMILDGKGLNDKYRNC